MLLFAYGTPNPHQAPFTTSIFPFSPKQSSPFNRVINSFLFFCSKKHWTESKGKNCSGVHMRTAEPFLARKSNGLLPVWRSSVWGGLPQFREESLGWLTLHVPRPAWDEWAPFIQGKAVLVLTWFVQMAYQFANGAICRNCPRCPQGRKCGCTTSEDLGPWTHFCCSSFKLEKVYLWDKGRKL